MIEIYLTQGKVALIDDEDWELVSQYKWYAHKLNFPVGKTFYAETKIKLPSGKRLCILMHRLLLSPTNIQQVDHKNGNGLDNRRENLRLATHTQNQWNKKAWGKSKYKGVCWVKKANRWQARISYNGKRIHLGYFTDEIAAAKAYDQAAEEYFGEFANLNLDLGVLKGL